MQYLPQEPSPLAHVVARCKFTSAMENQVGGIWTGGGGFVSPFGEFAKPWPRPVDDSLWHGGAIVTNPKNASCLKPIFPDIVRPYANRFDVAYTANGQCYSSVATHFSNIFGYLFYFF